MACVSNVLIVGGGIAGLAAAIALGKIGCHCDVLELAGDPTGASIGFTGRAADALVELGVYEECYNTGRPFEANTTAAYQYDAAGQLISRGPERPDWPGSKMGIGVYRPVLLKILEQAAERLGATIEKKVTVDRIEDSDDKSFVVLSTGEKRCYDFVIGADGVGSHTRSLVFRDAPKPTYAGQFSIRWMIPGPALPGEGWYIGPMGRVGFYHLPHQDMTYVPAVVAITERKHRSKQEVFEIFTRLLESFTAPAVAGLRKHLARDSELIFRPYDWILLPAPWYRGRTLLIGDAVHTTTSNMGMGGGMAIEDAVVLGQCIGAASTLQEALDKFMERRLERARIVVESSLELARLDREGASRPEYIATLSKAFAVIGEPY